jgi:hypothetical protein
MQVIDGRRVLSTFAAVRDGHQIKMARFADGTTGPIPDDAVATRPSWYVAAGPVRAKGTASAHKPRASRKPPVGGPRENPFVLFTPAYDRV